MTRYLLATWEGGGNVPPELGVARRLVERGHQVHVLADPPVEGPAKAAGCTFSPWVTAPHRTSLAPEDDLLRDWEFTNPLKLFKHALDVFIAGPADRYAADTRATIAAQRSEVLLADMMMFGASFAGEAARIPCAMLVPNISMRPAKGVPPLGPGFPRAKGLLGRLRDGLLRSISARVWRGALPRLNRARAALALEPIDDLWGYCDRLARVLVLTSPSFDFLPPELPANLRYTGPVLDDPSWAGTTWTSPWPASNTDPLILVGLSSTYQDQRATLERIVTALARLPVRALVTMGPALAGEPLVSPSPNVVIVQTAPHAAVLPHCAAANTHCGHGTTMRALAAGVPLLCMPMGRDQNDTAARVVDRGCGARLKPTASPAAIEKAMRRVLEPRYAEGARRMRDTLARESTQVDVAVVLEELLEDKQVRLAGVERHGDRGPGGSAHHDRA